jgi:predicted DNA-binding transcriptional regulator YafY
MNYRDRKTLSSLKQKYGRERIYEYITYIDCLYCNEDRIISNGIDSLNESVNIGPVADAIQKRWIVKIKYKVSNDDRFGVEERVIMPVAYGVSKAGNMVLRAYQPMGDTKTKVPHWKLFRLDRIVSWKALRNEIMHSAPNEDYNPFGDKTMRRVYRNADFKRSRYTNTALSDINRERRSRQPIENNRLVLGVKK